jgi:Ran GTPase-activating protein 1
VFKALGTLEEVVMPQNGIYHAGITALSEAFMHNANLRVLNLNDNTVTVKGAVALAAALPSLQKLQEINLGDCLLKTKGAMLFAAALAEGHKELQVT